MPPSRLKATFDNLFTSLNEDIDLEVRRTLTVAVTDADRDPVPASLVDDVAAVDGVARVQGVLQRYAQMLEPDGEPVSTRGAPAFGISWAVSVVGFGPILGAILVLKYAPETRGLTLEEIQDQLEEPSPA